MGSEEDAGLNALDYPYILDGHIPDKFEVRSNNSCVIREPTSTWVPRNGYVVNILNTLLATLSILRLRKR